MTENTLKVFMTNAKDMNLRDMLDETAMMLKEYESEAGTVQSFGYEVRHFYKKLYFNPGLYCDDNIDTTEEDIAIMTGDAIVEESVKEVVEKIRNLNQIK